MSPDRHRNHVNLVSSLLTKLTRNYDNLQSVVVQFGASFVKFESYKTNAH